MEHQFLRTERLLGSCAMEKIQRAHIAIFGVGGVGSYAAEALARCGIGFFTLVDSDVVSVTNINRQIIATHKTIGRSKVSVMKERILEINPDAVVCEKKCFFLPENADEFDFSKFDYVIDAVDTVSAKIEIIMRAKSVSVPVISSMGAGNKLDPSQFRIADIYETSVCPLARVMRQALRKRGVEHLKVVFSTEKPVAHFFADDEAEGCGAGEAVGACADCESGEMFGAGEWAEKREAGEGLEISEAEKKAGAGELSERLEMNVGAEKKAGRRSVPGSVAFVPSVAGLMAAAEVIKDIAGY